MTEKEEKKIKKRALMITVGIHLGLLVLFFFLLAWKEPYPPKPEYGIEINFGLDQTGSGQVQPETPPAAEPVEQQDEQFEEPEIKEEVQEEIIEELQPEEPVEEEVITQPLENPVIEEKRVEKPKPKQESVISEQPEKKDMAGWVWDFKPEPNDTSSESGRIVFQIKIDDQGEIISVRTLEKTVSPAVEKVYRQAVERLTFSRTADNTIPAPVSTGTITFIIKSR